MKIRNVVLSDLESVTELESRCFTLAEAAKRNSFELRINKYCDTFWVVEDEGRIISMINGMPASKRDLCDQMYEDTSLFAPDGEWLMLFGVATDTEYRRKGNVSRLMSFVIEETKKRGRTGIVLTCKKELIKFYSRFGFVNEGVSDSSHGGAEWYQMRLSFQDELFRCAEKGEECSFYIRNRRYLLYGWNQCDGIYLNVGDEEGNIIWQAAEREWKECAEKFRVYYSSLI
ncbi:GNAT family N-acetyltransferase [Ruminococcus sp. HUN007]|uniref:GNAT family N-acetyltransferase n=1 Tax=Ruminococcus sp. HUN007 TaxID=1514668 RepID=UPI0009DCA0E0|nr:GNAT family N-acetyltransferase [Ruminococcus sp. HUN007]